MIATTSIRLRSSQLGYQLLRVLPNNCSRFFNVTSLSLTLKALSINNQIRLGIIKLLIYKEAFILTSSGSVINQINGSLTD